MHAFGHKQFAVLDALCVYSFEVKQRLREVCLVVPGLLGFRFNEFFNFAVVIFFVFQQIWALWLRLLLRFGKLHLYLQGRHSLFFWKARKYRDVAPCRTANWDVYLLWHSRFAIWFELREGPANRYVRVVGNPRRRFEYLGALLNWGLLVSRVEADYDVAHYLEFTRMHVKVLKL